MVRLPLNRIKTISMLVIILSILIGCSSLPTQTWPHHWYKSDMTELKRNQDFYECLMNYFSPSDPMIFSRTAQDAYVRRCMESQGYILEELR